jgi:hypothetical protein
VPDAGDILDELTKRNMKLSVDGSIHDPTDPVGRLLFNVLAMVAEFEADLIRLRTRGRNESSQGGHHDVGERPLGFDRFRPHFVDGAVTTAIVDPCKKPRPQSGLLRQVPPALEAATDAMSTIPRAEARPRHQAVPQIRLLATIGRSMPFIERRKCLSWSQSSARLPGPRPTPWLRSSAGPECRGRRTLGKAAR